MNVIVSLLRPCFYKFKFKLAGRFVQNDSRGKFLAGLPDKALNYSRLPFLTYCGDLCISQLFAANFAPDCKLTAGFIPCAAVALIPFPHRLAAKRAFHNIPRVLRERFYGVFMLHKFFRYAHLNSVYVSSSFTNLLLDNPPFRGNVGGFYIIRQHMIEFMSELGRHYAFALALYISALEKRFNS